CSNGAVSKPGPYGAREAKEVLRKRSKASRSDALRGNALRRRSASRNGRRAETCRARPQRRALPTTFPRRAWERGCLLERKRDAANFHDLLAGNLKRPQRQRAATFFQSHNPQDQRLELLHAGLALP